VLPLLAVLAGHAVSRSVEAVRTANSGHRIGRTVTWRPLVAAVAAGLLVLAALTGLWAGLTSNSKDAARVQAAQWVTANLRAGSSFLVESYSPWIDPHTYRVSALPSLRTAELDPGTDYVVASEAIYGRFTSNPEEFPAEAAAYERLFDSLRLLQEFQGEGGQSVRIYEVPPRADQTVALGRGD